MSQIRINQDPYSAEFPRPGRGRIEVVLKPGSQEYHGVGNFIFRDAALETRNAFAATKPPIAIFHGDFPMRVLSVIAVAAAMIANSSAAFAGELPSYEVTSFPISAT